MTMEESSLQLSKAEAVQQNDDNTGHVNGSKNIKKPITEIIKTVLGDVYISCHICKIKFRKPCILNHFSSDYHKYNMKIFDEVLARYRNAMAEPVPDFEDQNKMALNYCDVCNLELMANEKDEHILSELHKNNENYVQNAMKLAHAYIFDSKVCNKVVEDDSEEARKKKSDGTVNKILNFIKQYFVHTLKNKMHCRICGIDVHAYNEILTHMKVVHEIVLSSDNVVSSIKINNELKIESHKHISIVKVKNVVMIVPTDAWQGLSGKTCLLCDNKQFNNKIEHIQNEIHVHNLFVASLIDLNGIREIKSSIFNCLVCQKVITADTYYNHLKSVDHKINYGEAVNKSCCNTVFKKEKYYHCSICEFDVPDIYKQRHESGPRHYYNLHFIKTIAVSNRNIKDSDLLGNAIRNKTKEQLNQKEPTIVSIIETTTKKAKNKSKGSTSNLSYTCETCDCQVPISAKDEHESGTRHKKNIQNKIKESKIEPTKPQENINENTNSESRKINTKSKDSTNKKKKKPNVPEYLQQWSNILQKEEQYKTDLNSNDNSYISCHDDEVQVNNNLESSLMIEEMENELKDNPEYSDMWKSLLQDDQINQEYEDAKCFNSTGIECSNLNNNGSNLLEITNLFDISLQPDASINKDRIKIYVDSNLKGIISNEMKETGEKYLKHACNQSLNLNLETSELTDVTNTFNITLGPEVPINRGSIQVYKSNPNDDNEGCIYYCIVRPESTSLEIPNVANYSDLTSNEVIRNSSEISESNVRHNLDISENNSNDNVDKDLNDLMKVKTDDNDTNISNIEIVKPESRSLEIPNVANYSDLTSNAAIRNSSKISESSVKHNLDISQNTSNDNVDKDLNDLIKVKTDDNDTNISNVDILKPESSSLEIPNVANYSDLTSNAAIRNSSEISESNVIHNLDISQNTSNDNVDKDFLNDLVKVKTDYNDTNISNIDIQQTDQICEESNHNDKEKLSDLEKSDNQQPCQTVQNETEKENIKKYVHNLETSNNQVESVVISVQQDEDTNLNTATKSTNVNKVHTTRTLETALPHNLDSNSKSQTELSNDFKNIVLSSTTNSDEGHKDENTGNIEAASSTFKSDTEDTKMKFNNDLMSPNISKDINDTEESSKSFAETSVNVYQVLNKIFGKGDMLNENNINYAKELDKYRDANKNGTKCKACNIIVKKSELHAHCKTEPHIKALNRSLQRHKTVSPKSDIITIDVEDEVMDVNCENYNGQFITTGNQVWCTFCECHAITADHIYNERHIETMKKCIIITSKDCVRNIGVGFAYCTLCNLIIQTGDKHTQTDEHIANLLKSIRTRY